MLATKRYEYLPIDKIQYHPTVINHRQLSQAKVQHYATDILRSGLLEPLVVWEKSAGEFYLIGGFHRLAAIKQIRRDHPGYFDRVDVRVVAGDVDEMRALNLKLNADRLDARLTDYFDTIVYLNNANWSKERIADFLDRSVTWVEEIIRFVPVLDSRLRKLLEEDKLSWSKAKDICRAVQTAPAGKEKAVLEAEVAKLTGEAPKPEKKVKPLPFRVARKRLNAQLERDGRTQYTFTAADILALVLVLEGKTYETEHVSRVRKLMPTLFED